jgi:putative endonuclease
MGHYVYILQSVEKGIYYVGETSNIDQRLEFHNSGQSSFTRKYLPWELVWLKEVADRKEALILEKKLKRLSGIRKKEFIARHS